MPLNKETETVKPRILNEEKKEWFTNFNKQTKHTSL